MDFEDNLKDTIKYLEKEEKFVLLEFDRLNDIRSILKKSLYPEDKNIEKIKTKNQRMILSLIRKISRSEYRRHSEFTRFSEKILSIKEDIVPERLKQISDFAYDYEIYDHNLVKFLSRGGILDDIFKGKPVENFDGSVSGALAIVSDIIEKTISPHIAISKDLRSLLRSKKIKVFQCHLAFKENILKKITSSFKKEPEVIFDTSFLKDFEDFRKSGPAEAYSIDLKKNTLVLLKSVMREARGINISGSLISYILSQPNTISIEIIPTELETEFLEKIWRQYSRKGSKGRNMDYADIRILTYAYRKASSGKPIIILTRDEDIESVVEFLSNYNTPRLDISAFRLHQVHAFVA